MDSAKNQLADKLKASNNVLVTVSRDPSVDQLAALLGLTVALNKAGKHAAAVFSGQVPSTLEFLQPEDTIEKNTDSLRDFIIALDKSKADKLRYKVEDDVVRIFITPYKTSISQADLEFSQGDFNVDVVIAIGVQQQEDLDEAITAHGRILHDATVTSITVAGDQSEGLGSINWHDEQASSLCELVTELVQAMGNDLIDTQVATALLTGIVAETERFSNEKTSSQTMTTSALLMAAGANQQLVATKLDEPAPPADEDKPDDNSEGDNPDDNPENTPPEDDAPKDGDDQPPKPDDGTIEIDHEHDGEHENQERPEQHEPEAEPESEAEKSEDPAIELPAPETEEPEEADESESNVSTGPRLMVEPPTLGGQLTANSLPEALDPANDALGEQPVDSDQLLERRPSVTPLPPPPAAPEPLPEPPAAPAPVFTPPPADWQNTPESTLTDLEAAVSAHHGDAPANADEPADLDDARDEVSRALNSSDAEQPLNPVAALNAQPLGDTLHPLDVPQPPEMESPLAQSTAYTSVEDLLKQTADAPVAVPNVPIPDDVVVQQTPAEPLPPITPPQVVDANAPPPVPPPMPFHFGQMPPQNPLTPPQ